MCCLSSRRNSSMSRSLYQACMYYDRRPDPAVGDHGGEMVCCMRIWPIINAYRVPLLNPAFLFSPRSN
jgi:hypothetical protein